MSKRLLLVSLVALSIAVLFALLPGRNARAATLCVNPGGTGGCYSSIQAAIDAAAPGDTINVAAGQYLPYFLVITKTLTLQGAGPSTVINVADSEYFQVSAPATLSNLAIQTQSWTGILVDGGPVVLRNIIITGHAWGIYNYGGEIHGSNLSIYSRDGLVCNMNATAIISNSVLTTLTRNHPLACSAVTLVNDTFVGTVYPGSSVVTATNTIFAGGCAAPPYNETIKSLGHNIDAGNNCTLNATGDMTNTNPLLTPPVMVNGVLVNALQPGSPAIDKGDDAACPSTDATGFARPYGAHCDIGAYEWRPMNFNFLWFPFIAR